MGQRHPNPERLKLGLRLRSRRTARGLTRRDVAAKLALSERRIGAFERGAAAISALELQALAELFGQPLAAFLGTAPAPETPIVEPTVLERLAASDEGCALAEAFVRLQTPRLRRHLVRLAEALVAEEARLSP